ncbi:MAG: DsbA family oxidoreductase [Pseudomonadales bacterium]|nr:DsbA family oxidoreductase [Pseudomonadales bacterium]
MVITLKLDIVSDISCPWCIIGYKALQQALARLEPDITADISWQPFELNPAMPLEGQDIVEHLTEKYGINTAQIEQNRAMIRERGLALGYTFSNSDGGRIYNTFDAHRLLHWAKQFGKQSQLKLAFFDLYFKQSGDPSDHQQLLTVVANVGLDIQAASQVLDSAQYEQEVRELQNFYHSQGISSVPAVIINDKHLISGGQPAEVFEKALKEIASQH